MNRALSIAVLASLLAHGLLLVLVRAPVTNAQSGLSNIISVLSYRVGALSGSRPAEPASDSPIPTPPIDPAPAPRPAPQPVQPSTQVAVADSAPKAGQHDYQLPAERAAVAEIELAEPRPAPSAAPADATPAAVATVARASQTVPEKPPEIAHPAPQTEPMPLRQARMLSRKLRRWADRLDTMDLSDGAVTWRHRKQEYSARFQPVTASDDTGLEQMVIEISTVHEGREFTTQVQMRRLAFSNFAQFVDHWNPNVQIHNDELDGRFHSNSKISLEYSRHVAPTFRGKVTTSSRGVSVAGSGGAMRRDDMFLAGLETGVRPIRLPKRFEPFGGSGPSDVQQVHYFEGDTRIRFLPDGRFAWAPADGSAPENSRAIADTGTTYLIGQPRAGLHVSGTVDGRVLVYSPAGLVIEGDLLYAHDPRRDGAGDDYLGLVSDKRVEIAPHEVTGGGDLRVFASIYAKRSFAVRDYRKDENALLYVYGSVAAGTMTATEPRYRTKFEFDPRLDELRAPGFPMTNRYELTAWDGNWAVRDAAR